MGEYLVGAYLKLVEGCDVVDYGVRTPGEHVLLTPLGGRSTMANAKRCSFEN